MSDDTEALTRVATGLIAKWREIAGRIEGLQGQLTQAVTDLDHVAASLRLFAPDISN
jgi:hypothetical protein